MYKGIALHVHPFVAAFLTRGFFSIQRKWKLQFKKRISIIPRDAFEYLQYHFELTKK